jgi:hypothetical protein
VLERQLRSARQELHNLQVMQMKPGSPERLELLRKLEVSCRAEVKLRRKALAYYIHSSQCGGGGRRDGLRFDRAQINSSSMCSTFTPMHASSSSAADAAETAAHENSAIFARLRGREAQPLVS